MKPVLNDAQREQISALTAQGKTPGDISKIMGIKYITIHNYVYRDKKKSLEKLRRNAKKSALATTSVDKFVDTGRVMPPTYKSELKIIADKDLAELACQQMGLGKPVCKLSERPMSYNANGWVRVGKAWVPAQAIHNDGMRTQDRPMMFAGRV